VGAEQPDARFAGVYAATTLAFAADGSVDLDRYAEHCAWLVAEGVAGIVPNGSLGEYETLTVEERAAVTRTAVEATGRAAEVVPGVAGKGGDEARRWTEQAAELGCPAVMALPPTSHAPSVAEVVAHYRAVADVGLPIVAYNNPFSTRVDLVPEVLARLADEVPEVVAVKEFSQDGRRVARIRELAPRLEVLCGCDDLLVESMLLGAVGWIAGFVNAFPAQSVALHRLCRGHRWDEAAALYRAMLPILRWDADPRFVQAIKLGQEEAGRYGGPVRLPRLPLDAGDAAEVRAAARAALDAGIPAAAPPAARAVQPAGAGDR
jgi:1-pyrroline-4-hydroxy-2-carboxylate deaminase